MKGDWNFLNVSQEFYAPFAEEGGFFTEVNGPWVDAAAARGDVAIVVSDLKHMATWNPKTKEMDRSGFGKEVDRLRGHGYTWNDDFTKLLPPQ